MYSYGIYQTSGYDYPLDRFDSAEEVVNFFLLRGIRLTPTQLNKLFSPCHIIVSNSAGASFTIKITKVAARA